MDCNQTLSEHFQIGLKHLLPEVIKYQIPEIELEIS